MWQAVIVAGVLVVFLSAGAFSAWQKRRRRRSLPPGNNRGWTNNTIRRQGETGKGIR